MPDGIETNEPRDVSWKDLEDGLVESINGMARTTFLVISARRSHANTDGPQSASHYVQFAQGGDEGFRAEAVSNRFLEGIDRLTPAQERKLLDVGWIAPDPDPRDDKADANWYREWPQPPPARRIAHLAIRTLRDVFGAQSPSELRYACFDTGGHHFALPTLPLDPEQPQAPDPGKHSPANAAELRPLVEAALKDFLTTDELSADENGDVPIRFGSTVVFVRVLDQPARVRMLSPILWSVPESPELLQAINDINLQMFFGRAMWTGQHVLLALEIPAPGITAEAVSFACHAVASAAIHFTQAMQARFMGTSAAKADA